MPPPSLKLPLTLAAANWIVKSGRDYDNLASWDAVMSGMPPPEVAAHDPVLEAVVPLRLQSPLLTAEDRARAMQRNCDPEERSTWRFVPGLLDESVWLVHVKSIPTALN